jgi:methylmalonyl-CoA mutase
MPDTNAQTTVLDLLRDFPPVETADWEAAIARDLKGADYEKRLAWRTDEGMTVRPYYRAESAPRRAPLERASHGWQALAPGAEPPADVDATVFHESGATAIQELAFALAAASDRLAAGGRVDTVWFAVGGHHFVEVAKLRAGRTLLAQVLAAYGAGTPAGVHLHVRTAAANKTLYDPYVNLLRVTTEALSAVVGGCDSLTVTPCGFDPHLAENVHHILREESRIDAVMDPAAGSYYVEALTDALSREAWTLFQQVETAGGLAAWRATGALDAALAKARDAKDKAIASRRRILVGTNNYPNVQERALGRDTASPGWRLASVFEAIRLRTERHAAATGRTPRVLLLERGDLKMRKARSAFCLNLFGCAGFDLVTADTLQEADLVVLCSADPEYLSIVQEVRPLTKAPIVVAGNPKDQAEALQAAGVAGFVHLLSNAVDTLTQWQDRLGIKD